MQENTRCAGICQSIVKLGGFRKLVRSLKYRYKKLLHHIFFNDNRVEKHLIVSVIGSELYEVSLISDHIDDLIAIEQSPEWMKALSYFFSDLR